MSDRLAAEEVQMASKEQGMQEWIAARKRHHSHAQLQMARELGMNPNRLGGLDNRARDPWKMPLPRFIEHLYEKRFGRVLGGEVPSVEVRLGAIARTKEARRLERRASRGSVLPQATSPGSPELDAAGKATSARERP